MTQVRSWPAPPPGCPLLNQRDTVLAAALDEANNRVTDLRSQVTNTRLMAELGREFIETARVLGRKDLALRMEQVAR
jgi:hypothetical protein